MFIIEGIEVASLLVHMALLGVRTIVALSLLPLLAPAVVPGLVRGALSFVIVLPVAMFQSVNPTTDIELGYVVILLLKEGAIGLVIGLGFGGFMAAIQAVGEIIDHQSGLTFTQNVDPLHGNSVSITSQFLERVFYAVLLNAGILLLVIDTLYLSYQIWPLGKSLPSFAALVPLTVTNWVSSVAALALLLAGPVLLVLFVIDAGMGMLNMAAPQFNVFGISLSLKPLVGIAVLALAMPIMIIRMLGSMQDIGKLLRLTLMQGAT